MTAQPQGMPEGPRSPLFVVITDYDGYEQTRRCLAALKASHYRDFRVIVVDHGTTPDTREGLRRDFPEVIRIAEPPDLWWTGATNRGIRRALDEGAQGVMLLNNDCYVAPETVGTLARLWQERPEAIIAPMQRDWTTGEMLCIAPRSLFLLGFPTWIGPRALSADMRSRELLPVRLICGGRGAILSRTVLEKNGLFDEERLPHYGADHDFYLRARKKGIALCTATGAIVDIDGTRTSLANDPGRLTVRDFVDTLQSVRSHRNIPHMTELFRLHYPLKHLHMVGVALYTARYVTFYALRRMTRMLSAGRGAGAGA